MSSVGVRRVGPALLAVVVLLGSAGCDRAPHERTSSSAAAFPVRGIDVSRHQADIDWPAVARSGADFVWLKATEGGDYLDPTFRRNWQLASAVGLRRGAYHFVYWCRRAEDQAAWFIANVPADPDALPPALDAEWNPQSRTCPRKMPREQALAMMRTILVAMEKVYGQKPLIYAPADFYDDVMKGELRDYPLWARSLGGHPDEAYDGRRWLVWQHTDAGSVEGIRGDVDENRFEGSRQRWLTWLVEEGMAPGVR